MDNLRWATLHQAKGRSQDFMAVDQIAQALLQNLNIERADDAITAQMSAVRVPAMVPDVLLKKRHRHRCRARNTNDWGDTGEFGRCDVATDTRR